MVPSTKVLLVALGLASEVMGHGAIHYSEADGERLAGYYDRVRGRPNKNDHSLGNNWETPKQLTPQDKKTDLGFISPEQYNTPDVICHIGATPAPGYLNVQAGHEVDIQWTDWPFSHHGPIIDYLSNCNGDCTNVDKTALKFHKIAELGLLDPSHKLVDPTFKQTSGFWAGDKFREAGSKWTVKIPATIAPGVYVLRHETFALHSSMKEIINGTQNYPQCFNLNITGSGTDTLPGGTPGMELYTGLEPGLHNLNIFSDNGGLKNYTIPGPPLHVFDGSAPAENPNLSASAAPSATASSPAGGETYSTSLTTDSPSQPAATATPTPKQSHKYSSSYTAKYQNSTATYSPSSPTNTPTQPTTPTKVIPVEVTVIPVPSKPAASSGAPSTDGGKATDPPATEGGSGSGTGSGDGKGKEEGTVNTSALSALLVKFEALLEEFKALLGQGVTTKRSVKARRHAKDVKLAMPL